MKVLILNSQDGQWTGLFIDGILIDEGDVLGEGDNLLYMLKKSEEYNFKSSDVIITEVEDEDEEYLNENGHFPTLLKELNGEY